METVSATLLKHRLGELLDRATLRKVAIERHGRVIAYLVPAPAAKSTRPAGHGRNPAAMGRAREDRLLDLFASGDLRPSRWRRAGDAKTMAGFAAFLASADVGDRGRLFALAESLHPGMSTVGKLDDWLRASRVEPARVLAMLDARKREARLLSNP